MSWITKLERKYGRYAIHNLSLIIIACYGLGYLIQAINRTFLNYLTLNPYLIVTKGQIWRILTWLIIPPSSSNIFFIFIMLFFYYSIGTSLEMTWGAFRYNVYIFSGMLFTVVGSFVCMGICYLFFPDVVALNGPAYFFQVGSTFFSTYYVNMSIFLAYAATFPENRVLFMFFIPIKVKWLGIVYGAFLVYDFITGGTNTIYTDTFARVALASSLLNFVLFLFWGRNRVHLSPKQRARQQEFRRETRETKKISKHKCSICGRTDETNPELEFRFCSKCNGNYEYCQDHLFRHEHVK